MAIKAGQAPRSPPPSKIASGPPNTADARNEVERFERLSLRVVDEIGDLPLGRQAADPLFASVARCYARGSIIVADNRGFEARGESLSSRGGAPPQRQRP